MSLPNIWNLFNLQANPFFQDTLQWDPPVYPLELFVGREHALAGLLSGIGGATSSRQVIAGSPGVGKTTLAQRVKVEAAQHGYVTNPAAVGILADDTVNTLLVRILAHVYEGALATLGREVGDTEALLEARHIVHAFRSASPGVGLGLAGVSVSYSGGRSHVSPVVFDAFSSVSRLLARIDRLVCYEHGRPGLIVHLNNLENLAERDRRGAAALLRDLRDVFLLNGYHWLVVGETKAVEDTLLVYAQVSSIFPTPEPLEPLTDDEFLALLERRYTHLALEPARPVLEPVSNDAALVIYRMFHGDLRGTLRALQEGAEALVGYGATDPVAPIAAEALLAVLAPRYRAAFEARRATTDRLLEQFDLLASFAGAEFTQADLQQLWGVSAGRVSQIIGPLAADGYIAQVGRRGREYCYRLTGAGQLVLLGRQR